MSDDLLTTKQLAEYLGVTARTLELWRETRVGPAWVRVGRKVRYRREDVEAWLESRRQTPVREEVA